MTDLDDIYTIPWHQVDRKWHELWASEAEGAKQNRIWVLKIFNYVDDNPGCNATQCMIETRGRWMAPDDNEFDSDDALWSLCMNLLLKLHYVFLNERTATLWPGASVVVMPEDYLHDFPLDAFV